jgi:hypothetical protein
LDLSPPRFEEVNERTARLAPTAHFRGLLGTLADRRLPGSMQIKLNHSDRVVLPVDVSDLPPGLYRVKLRPTTRKYPVRAAGFVILKD